MLRFGLACLFAVVSLSAQPLAIVAIDGLRHDFIEVHKMQTLARLRVQGATVAHMQTSFPSTTFPNFHSMATGLEPSRHGLVGMVFYDRARKSRFNYQTTSTDGSWYGGEPFWQTAEEAGKTVATFFWPGTDAGVNGKWPTYFRRYDWRVQHDEKVAQVGEWLALTKRRPDAIVVYFSDIDSMGHRHGPLALETVEAAKKVDASVARIAEMASKAGATLLIVSDHGQSAVEGHLDLTPLADFRGCIAANEAPITQLYCDDPARVYAELKSKEKGWKVYRKAEIPAHLNYRDNPRIGDLLIVPDRPWILQVLPVGDGSTAVPHLKGMHGYDPVANREMDAVLIGVGGPFKQGARVERARTVDVAPLILHLLGVAAPKGIDGDFNRVRGLLR
jgi:predicted AlkP superfamily pyrophosphatase or phosphodiesterase